MLKATPEKSNRQIAEEARADHKVVGRARKRLEATGAAPQLEKRVGADGKERRQKQSSGSGARKPPLSQVQREANKAVMSGMASALGVAHRAEATAPVREADVGPDSTSELERKVARLAELENTTRRLESENIGLKSEIKDRWTRASRHRSSTR